MKYTEQFNQAVLQILCAKEMHGQPYKDSYLITRSIMLATELFNQMNLPIYEKEV